MPITKPHVVVFFGGQSPTHDLSLATGHWACQYIPRARYHVTPVHITPEGHWQVPLGSLPQQGPVDRMMNMLFASVRALPPTQALERLLRKPVAAFFTLLRGAGGDDGSLQSLASALHIPAVGSPAATCQQTSHKQLCASRVADIVTSPFSLHFTHAQPVAAMAEEVADTLQAPFFVKPAQQEGSSGVIRVATADELPAALEQSPARDVVVQEQSPGHEFTITLLEDERGRLIALPPTTIVPKVATFYDELAKRRAGRVTLHTAAAQDDPVLRAAETIARDVYHHLGCRGHASFDMVGSDDGIDLLEVNTVPTVTDTTPLKYQLQAAGLHPSTMLDSLIRRSLNEGY